MSVSQHWADYLAPGTEPPMWLEPTSAAVSPPPAAEDRDPTSIDDGAYLTLTDDPAAEIRPFRDYSRDEIHGELRYRQRDYYAIATAPRHEALRDAEGRPAYDRTSLDDVGGAVLVGGGAIRYDSTGAGRNRLPSPPIEGQRLRRNRLGTGKQDVTATRTNYAPPEDGLEGGTAPAPTEAPPGSHLWAVVLPNGREIVVAARTKALARRAAKALLGLPTSDPLPAGTRIRCEG